MHGLCEQLHVLAPVAYTNPKSLTMKKYRSLLIAALHTNPESRPLMMQQPNQCVGNDDHNQASRLR